MRVVIDSNCLQSEELDDFLRMSSNNKAVLIDYAFIEAYKDETLVSIPRSMAVLRKYPNQVIVLHGTGKISRLSPSAKSIADRMIWKKYTKYFVSYCDALTALEKGDSLVIAQALTLGTKAQQIIDEMLNDSVEVTQLFAQFAKFFDNSQLKTIRKRLLVDDNFAALLMEILGATAFAWTEGHPHKVQHLKSNQLPNHLSTVRQFVLFCICLIGYGVASRWASKLPNLETTKSISCLQCMEHTSMV